MREGSEYKICAVCCTPVATLDRNVGGLAVYRETKAFGKLVGRVYLCQDHKKSACAHKEVLITVRGGIDEPWHRANCTCCGKVGPERATEETAIAALRCQRLPDTGITIQWGHK